MILRKAVKEDIPDIMRLVDEIYDYKWPPEFYLWQCFENVNPGVLIVAVEKNAVVGILGIQVRTVSRNIRCGQVSWVNVSVNWRKKGLLSQLGEKALSHVEDLDLLFIFSNQNAVKACEKSMKMRFIGKLNRLLRNTEGEFPNIPSVCEKIDNLTQFNSFNKAKDYFQFDHSSTYRIWRFVRSPIYTYYKVTISSGEYVIIKLFYDDTSGKCYGDIVDFECSLTDTNRLAKIFYVAIIHLMNKGASQITTWAVPHSPLRKTLGEIGFVESDHGCYFTVRVLNPVYANMYDFKSWHIVQSDATNY